MSEHLSKSNLLTATALLAHHTDQLRHWGVAGNSRYGLALSNFIADEGKEQQETAANRLLLVAIHNHAVAERDKALSDIDDLSEDEQRAIFAKVMQYQAIIEKASEAING